MKASSPRFVLRKSNTAIRIQVIKYGKEEKGDVTLAGAISKELAGFGWKHSFKNMPAAYLTGLLCGKRALKSGITNAILDIGLYSPVHGSRLFSAAKGAIDAGVAIKCAPEVLPKEERISGKHIKGDVSTDFEVVKKKIVEKVSV